MKFVRNTLIGLYVSLLLFILQLYCLLRGLIDPSIETWLHWLLLAAVVISGVFNIIFAVSNTINTYRLYKNGEYNSLRKHMKALKLRAIPYFILNFFIYVLLFMLFFAASRGLIIFTPIPLLFLLPMFFTYLNVLSTSSYGIGFAAILKKEKKLKTGSLIIHILLQLCFVLDVIDMMILVMKYKAKQISELKEV